MKKSGTLECQIFLCDIVSLQTLLDNLCISIIGLTQGPHE